MLRAGDKVGGAGDKVGGYEGVVRALQLASAAKVNNSRSTRSNHRSPFVMQTYARQHHGVPDNAAN